LVIPPGFEAKPLGVRDLKRKIILGRGRIPPYFGLLFRGLVPKKPPVVQYRWGPQMRHSPC